MEPLTLKGKAEPVPAYRLAGDAKPAAEDASRHAVRRPRGRDGAAHRRAGRTLAAAARGPDGRRRCRASASRG